MPVLVLGTVLAILASIAWLDRPAAHFAHNVIGRHPILLQLTRPPEYLGRFSLLFLVMLGLWALWRPLGAAARGLLLASLSLTIAEALHTWLKLGFGRTWPETWIAGNPSFIRDGVFRFFPFHGGPGFASFPSGHMTAIASFVGVFWLLAPSWRGLALRPVWGACILAVAIGLYGMDYHFVSDMLAGTLLGFTVAAVVVSLAGRRGAAGR